MKEELRINEVVSLESHNGADLAALIDSQIMKMSIDGNREGYNVTVLDIKYQVVATELTCRHYALLLLNIEDK